MLEFGALKVTSLMSSQSAFHPSTLTLCSGVLTLVKFSYGILDQNTYQSSKRHYRQLAIHILFMRCKWLVRKMPTTLSQAVPMAWFVVGW
jgi:hypothetical protein